jgi:hypothetical protein
LLCTAAGRFQRSALAADSIIIIPDAAERLSDAEAASDECPSGNTLNLLALIFRQRFEGCAASSLARLIHYANYLGAEEILDGNPLFP